MADDAKITVGADTAAVDKAAKSSTSAWEKAGKEMHSAISNAAKGVITDLTNVATSMGKVNFAAQHASVREFEGATARLSVAMGRDLEGVRGKIEATGVAIGKRPAEVAAWVDQVGRLTYNFEGAGEAIKGLSGLAAETGRSVDDYKGLAVQLANVGKVGGDTTHVLGMMQSQAEKMNTTGGIAAFSDQIEGLGDTISHFAVKSEADFTKITGLAAVLGKGFSPQAAQRVTQGAFGAVASDPMGWSRYLGKDITDEFGQVKNPTDVLKQITDKIKKTYGKDSRRMLMLQFGAETGSALARADFKSAAEMEGLTPSGKGAAAQAKLLGTDFGKREQAAATLDVSSRELMGSATLLGKAADSLQQFAAHNPFTSTLVSSALSAGASSVLGSLMKNAIGKVGPGGLFGIGGGPSGPGGGAAAGALGKAGAVGAALMGGYALGSYLDEKFDLSGKSVTAFRDFTGEAAADRAREKAGLRANFMGLASREVAKQGRVATLEGLGMAHGKAVAQAENEQQAQWKSAHSGGLSKEGEVGIAKAVADGFKSVQMAITTAPETPVTVSVKSTNSRAAGSQKK